MQRPGNKQDLTVKRPIRRYQDGKFTESLDDVLRECELTIFLEGQLLIKLVCIPEYLEELVLGYLHSEGLICSNKNVESIDIVDNKAHVHVTQGQLDELQSPDPDDSPTGESSGFFLTTDSGDFRDSPYPIKGPGIHPQTNSWDANTITMIVKNANLLLERSEIFKRTGNVHSAMLCKGSQALYFCEDIGRYNAFDKCIGFALRDNVDLSQTTIFTSGRIPSSVALKVIRSGIPMIVSRSAPSDMTLELAKSYGLTVVGFARGGRFNLYNP
ncbi:MAG: formate dehydrogenase accessory sulfurtransferase FdhD [Coriobacteriales bacterium]|jgi:FdhD protein|nr:formate dehydrogenase accessory sulfurtransferase FdhD [Coriobacteriales bacterium]